MKIAKSMGLLVAAFVAMTFATASKLGARGEAVGALAARGFSVEEIEDIMNIFPRQDPAPTVTVTVNPATCAPNGTPATSGSVIPPPATASTEVPLTTTTSTSTVTPTSTTETPTATPTVPVPVPSTSETPSPPTPLTVPDESSVPATSALNTPTPATESSTVVLTTTSSALTQTSVSTTSTTTHSTATPSTSSGIPPAPNNGASSAGVNIGVLGLVAVLALA